MIIDNVKIGSAFKPYIIAELSGNHNQSLERAIKIIKAAAKSGVDALKIQTYTADTMTLNVKSKKFYIKDKKSLWANNSLYDLYKKAYTPWEWHEKIFKEAKKLNLTCFSTPFDITAVEFLEKLKVPAYKIASFENNDIPLIKKIASTKKPIIMSTGVSTLNDLIYSYDQIKKHNKNNLALLKCTSTYPATPKDSNILTINHMKDLFDCEIGLSDHTLGIGVSIAAISHGASIIEKHFTLDRSEGGVDAAFSLEPEEMKNLVIEAKNAWESLGQIKYGILKSEHNSIKYKRSIYVSKNVKKGDIINEENIRIIRPGYGLNPRYYDQVIGREFKKNITKGTPLDWQLI